jgi:acyl-coenzyme A thioesterase PaaI-like protein
MTEDELQVLLERTLPLADLHGAIVEEIEDQDVRLRFPGGAGGGAQARLLAFIDAALRAAALPATVVLANLNVTFLKAAGEGDAIALARVIRRDDDTVHAEVWLFSHAAIDPVAHATATFRIS